jgi:hypothetical protein
VLGVRQVRRHHGFSGDTVQVVPRGVLACEVEVSSVSLAWLLAKGVTAPIASARTIDQLDALLAAPDLVLSVVAMSIPYAGQTIDNEHSADDSLMGEHSRHLVPLNTVGDLPQVGSLLPSFTLVKSDLSELRSDELKGKKLVLNIFPSVDTGVAEASLGEWKVTRNT